MTPATGYLHEAAHDLWLRTLGASERVLITGATGWFGRTATALLRGSDATTMLTASRARTEMIAGRVEQFVQWKRDSIERFEPTLVIDCAFLTRDLVATQPLDEYLGTNRELMAALMETIAIPSVTRLITVSSGAAVYPVDALTRPIEENPYGYLKRQIEDLLAEKSGELGVATAVARAWSVSGSLVQKPGSYALTDMIAQAKAGHISISATRPVYRRYSSVEDLLSVSLAAATIPGSVMIDSGGELVEMSELAQRVIAGINPAATVSRPALTEQQPNQYYADDEPWQAWCDAVGLTPSNLDEQIAVAALAV